MSKLPKNVSALLSRIYDDDVPTVKKSKRLKLGNLYLFGYDAKTKSQMEFWDSLPLMILLSRPSGGYLLGCNLHFIPYTFRIVLGREISKRMKSKRRLKYGDILKAWKSAKIPKAYLYLSVRKYIISRIQTNVKVWEGEDDWNPVVARVLPKMKKKSASYAIKAIQRKFREHKAKQKQSK